MLFKVAGFTASLKVITTGAMLLTLVAPFAGVTAIAVREPGPTGVTLVPVLKLLENGAAALPWTPLKPPTATW